MLQRLAVFALLAALAAPAFGAGVVPGSVAADAGNGTLLVAWTPADSTPAVLQVAIVDLRAVEITARGELPSSGVAQDGAAVSFNGSTFMVAWMEGTDVRAARIGTDGTILDPEPIVIARGARPQKPGLAWDGQAWIAGWSEPDSRIQLRRLSAAGALMDDAPTILPPLAPSLAIWPSRGEFSPQIDCNGSECLVVAFAASTTACRILCQPGPQVLGLWVVDSQLVPRDREAASGYQLGFIPSFDIAWGGRAWLLVWGEHLAKRIGRDGQPLDLTVDNNGWPPERFEMAHAAVLADGSRWTIVRDSQGRWPLVMHETRLSEDATSSPALTALQVARGSSHPILVRGPEPWLVWTVAEGDRHEVAVARLADQIGVSLSFDLKAYSRGGLVHASWTAPPEDPDFYEIEMATPLPEGGIEWKPVDRLPGSARAADFLPPPDFKDVVRVLARWTNGLTSYSNVVTLTPARNRPATR